MEMSSLCSSFLKHLNTDLIVYCLIYCVFVLANKYVLSVVGFVFPGVFQGWQVLASVVYLFYIKRKLPSQPVSSEKYQLVIDALLFVAVIVTGSKSLASVPVAVYLSVQNVPMMCYLILSLHKVPLTEFFIAITGLTASLCLFIFKDDNLSDDSIFWLIWHCIVSMIFETYFQSDDSKNKELLRNYYRNVLSFAMLLVWIIGSDEIELASKFSPKKDTWFFSTLVLSGILCAVINTFEVRSHSAHGNIAQATARIPPMFLSLYLFSNNNLTFHTWNLIGLNTICSLLLSVSLPQQSLNNEAVLVPV